MFLRSILQLFTGIFCRSLTVFVLFLLLLASAFMAAASLNELIWPECYDWEFDFSMTYAIADDLMEDPLEVVDLVYVYRIEGHRPGLYSLCDNFGDAVAVIADKKGLESLIRALRSDFPDSWCPDREPAGPTFQFEFLDRDRRTYAPFYGVVDLQCLDYVEVTYPDVSSHYSVNVVPWLRERGLLE